MAVTLRRRRYAGVPVALAFLLLLLATPTSAAPAAGTASPLPSDRLHFGLSNGPGSLGWMTSSGVPWRYRYTYLAGGLYNNPWPTWQDPALPPGQYALDYMRNSAANNYIPVFPYYMLLQSHRSGGASESDDDYANLNNTTLMHDYYANFTLLMQKAAEFGGQVVVHVEPDLWGYLQQRSNNTVASNVSASVASSGNGDVAAYPNNVLGFAQALQHLRDLYAPNVLLAWHASPWSSMQDIGTNTDPSLNAAAEADKTATFFNSASPAGWNLVFNDVDDHDAAWWETQGVKHWWDPTNQSVPNFARYLAWVSELHARTAKPQVVWQVPEGNQYFLTENNTCGHYQDNVAQYFLAHTGDLYGAGLIAVLFGAGNACQTTNEDTQGDGVTNNGGAPTSDAAGWCSACNTHTSAVSDDDGGYLRMAVGQYYSTQPPAAGPGSLHPLIPARILDTRSGLGGLYDLSAGQRVELGVLGVGGVPSSGVQAVVLNLTAADAAAPGFIAAYAGGTSWPGNSNLNFGPGQASTNLVVAPVGGDGKVAFANGSSGQVALIADVMGWIDSGSPASAAGRLTSLAPQRILDTRSSGAPVAPGTANAISLAVTGAGGVPASGVSAVVLNVTVTGAAAGGFLAVYPAGQSWPGNSNVNFGPGQTIPNRVIATVGAGGRINIATSTSVHVIVDVGGWFSDGSASVAAGTYTPLTPARLLDTRGSGGVGPGGSYALGVAGHGGVPASGVRAVAVNVTAVDVTAPSFVAVYPHATSWQVTSDLNTSPGTTSTNLVIVQLGPDGAIALANASGSVDLIVDVVGWYS